MTFFLCALFLIGIVSGATAGLVGFGIGSLLTPLIAARYGTPVAVAAVAIPHLLATALRMVRHRAHLDWALFRRFGLISAAGGLAGAVAQPQLGGSGLTIVLGALLVLTAVANLTQGFHRWQPSRRFAPLLGGLSGLFGGLAGNQGGLRAAALLPYDLAPRSFLAMSTAVALAVDLARTPFYLVSVGSKLLPLAGPIAVAAAGCLLGTVLGERLLLGLPVERYRRLVAAAVGALGVWILVQEFWL